MNNKPNTLEQFYPPHRFSFVRVLVLLFFLSGAIGAWAETVDNLLQQFSQKPTVQTANLFMAEMHRAEITDERIAYPNDTPKDTLLQQVYYWAAEYFYAEQQYQTAADYGERAFPYCQKGNNRTIEGDCANLLAICYIRLSQFGKAAAYAKRCYALDLKSGNPDNISSSLNTLTAIYMTAHNSKKAEQYVLKGIEYSRKANNPQRMAVLQGMASEVYLSLGDSLKAYNHAAEALSIEQQLGRKDKIAVRQTQMATALVGLHDYQQARQLIDQAIPQLKADHNLHSLALALLTLGHVLQAENDGRHAVQKYREAADIFIQQGDIYNESHARLALYNALKDRNPQAAMAEMDRYQALRDSIYNREVAESMGRYGVNVDTDSAHKRAQLWGLLIIIALLLCAATAIYIYFRRKTLRQKGLNTRLSAVMEELRQENERLRQIVNQQAPAAPSHDQTEFVAKCEAMVNQLIDADKISVDALAKAMNLTPSQLRQRIGKATDDTVAKFIQSIRIRRARHLIDTHSDLTFTEVAFACRYSDLSNFNRAFKQVLGLTPAQYVELRTDKPKE